MTAPSVIREPGRVDEPQDGLEYAQVLTQVAADHFPIIVRRNGKDLAAVVPLEYLEVLREVAARREVERLAAQIDWGRVPATNRPPQEWFDDNDNPFAPENSAP